MVYSWSFTLFQQQNFFKSTLFLEINHGRNLFLWRRQSPIYEDITLKLPALRCDAMSAHMAFHEMDMVEEVEDIL